MDTAKVKKILKEFMSDDGVRSGQDSAPAEEGNRCV